MVYGFQRQKSGLFVPSPGGLPGFQRQGMDQRKKATVSGWNANDKGPDILLSADQFTASGAATLPTNESVRSVVSRASGKVHFEFNVIQSTGGALPLVGLANAAMTLAFYPGQDGNGIGVNTSGNYFQNGAGGTQDADAWTTGALVAIEADLDAKKFWLSVNGGNWNNGLGAGNPATGTFGDGFAYMTGPFFIAFAPGTALTQIYQLNVGQTPFLRAVTPGYSAWGS